MMYLVEISPRKLRGVVSLTAVTFASLGKLSGRLFGLRYVHRDSSFLFSDHFTGYESLISTECTKHYWQTMFCSGTVRCLMGQVLEPFNFDYICSH